MSVASLPMPPHASAAKSMISFIGPILHGPCSAVNKSFRPATHTCEVDIQLQRVIAEIGRLHPKQKGREMTWLADTLGLAIQVVNNWKSRGIPPRQVGVVATAIKWSMEQVSGEDPPPSQWPFESVPFARFDGLTERQKGVVEQAMLDAMDKVQQTQANGSSGKQTGTDG